MNVVTIRLWANGKIIAQFSCQPDLPAKWAPAGYEVFAKDDVVASLPKTLEIDELEVVCR